ncbi:Uncharacterized protein FKW44_021982, partial [Caligus rogercresseyi]
SDGQICSAEIKFRRPLSLECQDLIHRCLRKRPYNRIQLHDILRHPWLESSSKDNEISGASSSSNICPSPLVVVSPPTTAPSSGSNTEDSIIIGTSSTSSSSSLLSSGSSSSSGRGNNSSCGSSYLCQRSV